jgi:hypothetical protein
VPEDAGGVAVAAQTVGVVILDPIRSGFVRIVDVDPPSESMESTVGVDASHADCALRWMVGPSVGLPQYGAPGTVPMKTKPQLWSFRDESLCQRYVKDKILVYLSSHT